MNLLTIKTMNDGSIIRSLVNYETEDEGHVKKCERYTKTVVHIPEETTESEGNE